VSRTSIPGRTVGEGAGPGPRIAQPAIPAATSRAHVAPTRTRDDLPHTDGFIKRLLKKTARIPLPRIAQ
jgi:hypothetical protein